MTIEIKKQYDLVDYETSLEFMQLRVNQILNKSKNELRELGTKSKVLKLNPQYKVC